MKHRLLKVACTILLACSLLILFTAFTTPTSTKTAPTGSQNGSPQSITLAPTYKDGTVHPDTVWACFAYTQAWKSGTTTMAGYGQINCSLFMRTIDMTESAIWCQPVLWGCLWFNQGQIGAGCTFSNVLSGKGVYCPKTGVATWSKNIKPGQLWGIQTDTCAYSVSDGSACGTTQQNVQF